MNVWFSRHHEAGTLCLQPGQPQYIHLSSFVCQLLLRAQDINLQRCNMASSGFVMFCSSFLQRLDSFQRSFLHCYWFVTLCNELNIATSKTQQPFCFFNAQLIDCWGTHYRVITYTFISDQRSFFYICDDVKLAEHGYKQSIMTTSLSVRN